ncbi:hypothetical protein Ciccas_012738, partial [Cichlidogyrus casuarinus]
VSQQFVPSSRGFMHKKCLQLLQNCETFKRQILHLLLSPLTVTAIGVWLLTAKLFDEFIEIFAKSLALKRFEDRVWMLGRVIFFKLTSKLLLKNSEKRSDGERDGIGLVGKD